MSKAEGVEIDKQRVKKILYRLILLERTNIKTKQYNETEMVKQIKKIIEEEVQCF